jgi:cell wall-associated NlpC family hydrolase
VTALRSHVYSRPDIKAPVSAALPCGAEVAVVGEDGAFARPDGGGYLPLAHLAARPGDPVAQARRFLGVPYLWGGRSAEGIDCSGLVQLAHLAAGLDAPRDSDMQEAALGALLPSDAPLQRGDLVFWRGHVGLMADATTLLHANAFHMAVAEEPLAAAVARIRDTGGGVITARRRSAGQSQDTWKARSSPSTPWAARPISPGRSAPRAPATSSR